MTYHGSKREVLNGWKDEILFHSHSKQCSKTEACGIQLRIINKYFHNSLGNPRNRTLFWVVFFLDNDFGCKGQEIKIIIIEITILRFGHSLDLDCKVFFVAFYEK